MNKNKLTPALVAKSNLIFYIPLYQRLFEWDEKQIVGLLYDLHQAYKTMPQKPYYIGMLTAMQRKEDSGYDLVDGQQRFTIMTLLGICMGWNNFTTYNGQLRLRFSARPTDESYMRHQVGLTSLDNDRFNEIKNAKMQNGLNYIYEYLQKNKLDNPPFYKYVYEKLTFFVSYLDEKYTSTELNCYFERMNTTGKALEPHEIIKVNLLRQIDSHKVEYTQLWNACSMMDCMLYRPTYYNHEVAEEDATPNSWDTLRWRYQNAIVELLNISDSFTSKYKEIITSLHSTDADEILNKSKAKCIKSIKSVEDPEKQNPNKHTVRHQNIYALLTFPEFLLQVLYITLGCADDISISGNIPEYINKDGNRKKMSIVDFFDIHKLQHTFECYVTPGILPLFYRNLLLYRMLADYYLVRACDKEETPYILRPYKQIDADTDAKKKLLNYETMLYSASSSMTYYYWVAPLLVWLGQKVKAIGHIYIPESEILTALEQIDEVWHPNIFIKDNTNEDIVKHLRYDEGVDRYYFWRIDYYLWKNRKDLFAKEALNLAEQYIFRRNRSIEHVAPQHVTDNSTTPFRWDEMADDDPNKKLRHDIGNLCMISSGQNSTLKNSSFEIKHAHVEEFVANSIGGHIESLKMLFIYSHYSLWTLESIEKHTQETIEWLQKSYKYGLT